MYKIFKNALVFVLLLALAMSLVITTSAFSNSASASSYSEPKKVKLTAASFCPKVGNPSKILSNANEKLKELSGGTMEMDIYYDGTLVSFTESFSGAIQGVADITIAGFSVLDSATKLNQVFNMLFKHMPTNAMACNDALWKFVEEFPQVEEELNSIGVKRIGIMSYPGSVTVLGSTNPINSLSDIKGETIQCSQTLAGKLFTKMGATSVSMADSEYYTSLERGVTTGIYDALNGMNDLKIYEVVPHYATFGEGGISSTVLTVIMNYDKYISLTEFQQEWLKQSIYYGVECAQEEADIAVSHYKSYAKEHGYTFYDFTNSEMEIIYNGIDEVVEEWIKSVTSAGWDAAGAYKLLESIFANAN